MATTVYGTLQYVLENLPQIEANHAAVSKPTPPELKVDSFHHKFITLRGYKYHYVEEGDPNGIPLILLHGFPDLWYGWRNQIRHLEKQGGYHIFAFDLLGYGDSDQPRCTLDKLDPYHSKNLVANMIDFLDQSNIEKAVFIGHDWQALAYFNGSYALKPGTNVEEKEYYIKQFTRTSFHGGYNYYRAPAHNHAYDKQFIGKRYTVPSLLATIEKDPMITPSYVAVFPTDIFESLEVVNIPEGGHNVLTENPEAVNKILAEYLAKFFVKSRDGMVNRSGKHTQAQEQEDQGQEKLSSMPIEA
ncbi:Bifunctional epoxide hydrolase 2 [Mortierella claussenii]|nr:Bifunctional epoxide hydrolase 2 [Mortierella claussenii]